MLDRPGKGNNLRDSETEGFGILGKSYLLSIQQPEIGIIILQKRATIERETKTRFLNLFFFLDMEVQILQGGFSLAI